MRQHGVRFADLPMPAAVAARPRDERGYPVPAITPWLQGRPRFAATGTARTFLCAVERRCSICGVSMAPGPVWRVVSGSEAEAITVALGAGRDYRNSAATVEAPGHRACMLYAAVVCPYLARPTARRGHGAAVAGLVAARGDRRGLGGAVVSFAEVTHRYAEVVLFRFAGLGEFRRHQLGDEHAAELAAEVAAGRPDGPACPGYLLADEEAAERRFDAYLRGELPIQAELSRSGADPIAPGGSAVPAPAAPMVGTALPEEASARDRSRPAGPIALTP